MTVLYLSEQGATLRMSGERFLVTKGGETLAETPALKIEQVVIFGNGLLTPQTMDYLLKNNIDVSFLTLSGRYRGRLQPPLSNHLALRRAQYEAGGDNALCLEYSKAIVTAKIKNSTHLLIKKGRKSETAKQCDKLRRLLRQVPKARDLDRLRGIEGSASVAYFEAFRGFFKKDMGFHCRIKHPPTDPVNIVLSLGYTLLYNLFHGMIDTVGMDPFLGFLHQPRYGHASLASDLMEALRAPVIDTLVLRVFNLGILQEKDFTRKDGKVIFEKEGVKRYLEAYDDRVRTRRRVEREGKVLDFKQTVEGECRHLARVLLEKVEEFRPFLWGGT